MHKTWWILNVFVTRFYITLRNSPGIWTNIFTVIAFFRKRYFQKCKKIRMYWKELTNSFKGLGGFRRLKTGTLLLFFFYISNEIFYSNSLPYKRYIFDKYFVKFLFKKFWKFSYWDLIFHDPSKKSSLGVVRITHDRYIWN